MTTLGKTQNQVSDLLLDLSHGIVGREDADIVYAPVFHPV